MTIDNQDFKWTPEASATLQRLWPDERESARTIADALGKGCTRNAVIGKANRLRLKAPTRQKFSYQVEADIPIPPSNKGNRTKRRCWKVYPFEIMSVGDSFLVPCTEAKIERTRNQLTSAAASHSDRHPGNRKYCTRRVDGGIRAWRIA